MEQTPDEHDAVRRRMAELRAKAETRRGLVTANVDNLNPHDVRRLVQDLQVHQIELEMQYEELLTAQAERETYYQQYVDLFEFAPVGYCTLDAAGLVQQLNLRGGQLLGVARGKVLGKRFAQYVPMGEERSHFYDFLRQVLESEHRQTCALEMLRPDGSYFFAQLEGVRLHYELGEARCRLAFTDDTARHQAVQDLAASERKFRTLFEDSADAAVLMRDFEFVDCNRAALAMLGATQREQLLGRPALLLTPEWQPDGTLSAQRLVQSLEEAQRRGSHRFEWLRHRFSGEEVWQEIVLTPMRVGGEVLVHAVWRDITAQKHLDQRLRESETRFRTIFEQSHDATLLLQGSRYIDCNAAALRLIGAERREQLVGQLAWVRTPEVQPSGRRTAEWFAENTAAAVREGSFRCEAQMEHFDGRRIWVEAVLTPITPAEQEPLMHVVWRDVTEQKRLLTRLQDSQKQFSSAMSAARMGLAVWDFVSWEVRLDARAAEIYGYPPAEVTLNINEVIGLTHPDDYDALTSTLQQCGQTKEPFAADFRLQWPDGTVRYVKAAGQMITDDNGQLTRAAGVVRDVTAQRLNRLRLQQSEERLRNAVQAAHLGVGEWNLATGEVLFDERIHEMFGWPYSAQPATLAQATASVHPDDRARVQAALVSEQTDATPREVEYRLVRPDGSVRHVVTVAAPLPDVTGQYGRRSGVMNDVTEAKLARQQLLESETRLKTAIEAAEMGIGIWNFTTQMFFVDERARRMLGLPPEGPELTFAELMAVVHPADQEQAATALQRAAAGEGPLNVEVRILHPDGALRYVAANGQVLHGEQGAPLRMSGVLRDVTEQHLSEQRLRESEEQLRTALSAANMGVGLWELGAQELVLDERTAEIFGFGAGAGRYPVAELRQRLHPDDLPGVTRQTRLSLQNQLAFSLHVRVLRPTDNSLRYVRISGQALYDDHGQPSRVAGVARDITEFRRANLRLRESEERLRLALQSSATGVFEWSFETDELFWDERTQLIFGRPYEDRRLTFDAIRYAVHPADAASVTAALTRSIRDGVPFELEHRIVRPDGEVRHVASSGQVQYDDDGKLRRLAGLVRDVTERRQAQEELGYKNRLLDHILSTIPVVLSRVAADGTLEEVVGAGLRRLGLADNAVAGRNVFEAWPQLTGYIQRLLAGEKVQFVGEPPPRHGEQVYFQNYGFFDEERQSGVLFGIDVTETHQANARLAADAAFLQGLVSNIQEGIMAFDAQLRVTEWSYLMEQYLLVERGAVLGRPVFEALPAIDNPRYRDILARTLAGEAQTYYNVPFTLRPGQFDAAFVPLHDAGGAVAGVLGVIRDVTERNRLMEEATRLRLQREKEVLSAIMHTQEDERKRIAEALHNGVGQLLYAAKLHLYNQPVEETHRAAALGLLNEAIKQTRTISFELTPNILEDFGLKTALEELCKRIPKQNLHVHLSVAELPAGVSRLIETAVYRIVQELLNNVIKHAEAREAFVYVEPQGPQLHVSVEDDGGGFDVEAALHKRGGIGLAGIRNRVSLLAGQLSLRSMPGRGTTITIELPLTGPDPEAKSGALEA
jgi:PAS domain S-box-containing protein